MIFNKKKRKKRKGAEGGVFCKVHGRTQREDFKSNALFSAGRSVEGVCAVKFPGFYIEKLGSFLAR